jgi:hypothetical protein
MALTKYLYLTNREWCSAWVNGGIVPLSLASAYRAMERHQTRTPDENVIRSLRGMDGVHLSAFVQAEPGTTVTLQAGKAFRGHELVGTNIHFQQSFEDGLILCLSNFKSQKIARRLNKEACVRILDVESLYHHISTQLGVTGNHGPCQYTSGVDRNVFLKDLQDQWQHEYRLYWRHQSMVEVSIPPGTAIEESLLGAHLGT